jgi:hypothetical protein
MRAQRIRAGEKLAFEGDLGDSVIFDAAHDLE